MPNDMGTMKHVDRKALISVSREVVQTADDSREIAVKRMDEVRMNADKDVEAAKLANSRARTKDEMQGRMNTEAATADANRGRANANQAAAALNRAREMQKLNLTGIATPLPGPIKPQPTLNRARETRRRIRTKTGSQPQTRINNSSKQYWIAKNCAPNCSNNSTLFLPRAIPPAASS
jgi:hypothetical protein